MFNRFSARLGLCRKCMGLSLGSALLLWLVFGVWWFASDQPQLAQPGSYGLLLAATGLSGLFLAHLGAFTYRFFRTARRPCGDCGSDTRVETIAQRGGDELSRRAAIRSFARVVAAGAAISVAGLLETVGSVRAQAPGNTCGMCTVDRTGLLWFCNETKCPDRFRCIPIVSEEHAQDFCARFKNPRLICRICVPR